MYLAQEKSQKACRRKFIPDFFKDRGYVFSLLGASFAFAILVRPIFQTHKLNDRFNF